jgi:hypothetical protein
MVQWGQVRALLVRRLLVSFQRQGFWTAMISQAQGTCLIPFAGAWRWMPCFTQWHAPGVGHGS